MAEDLRIRYALTIDARDLDAALNGEGQEQWVAEGRLRDALVALAAVGDHGAALRTVEMENLRRAYNATDAMRGVEKRRADRLKVQLEHAKGALAKDSEAMAAFMADHAEVVKRLRESVAMWQRATEKAEEELAENDGVIKALRRQQGEAEAELASAQARIHRLDALHQPRTATEWRPCKDHIRELLAIQKRCGMCADRPTVVCSSITCCNWPCDAHLALHGETEDTCTHREAM